MKIFYKVAVLLLAASMLQLVASCCSDIEKGYINVFDFKSELYYKNLVVKDTLAGDTLEIRLQPEFTFVSANNSFTNTAFALSNCPNPGEDGHKAIATALEITYLSDSAFKKRIPAGALMNKYFKCTLTGYSGEITVDSLLKIYKQDKYAFNQPVTFYLRTAPDSTVIVPRSFNFKFTKSDSSTINVKTREIYW